MNVDGGDENPHNDELSALSNLRHLRSLFLNMYFHHLDRDIGGWEKNQLRASLVSIVDQGLLEVSMPMESNLYEKNISHTKTKIEFFSSKAPAKSQNFQDRMQHTGAYSFSS